MLYDSALKTPAGCCGREQQRGVGWLELNMELHHHRRPGLAGILVAALLMTPRSCPRQGSKDEQSFPSTTAPRTGAQPAKVVGIKLIKAFNLLKIV